jgi:hypothetical protein
LDSRIVHRARDVGSIDRDGAAGRAGLHEFDDGLADYEVLAEAESAAVEAGARDVFAEGSGEERVAEGSELFDSFKSDEQRSFLGSAVEGEAERIADEACRRELSFIDREFGDSACARDAELMNLA